MPNRKKLIVVGFNEQSLGRIYISGVRKRLENTSSVPVVKVHATGFETPNHRVHVIDKNYCDDVTGIPTDFAYGPEWLRAKVRAFEGCTCEYSIGIPDLAKFIEERENEIGKIVMTACSIYHDGTGGLSAERSVAHPKPESCLACERRVSIKKVHFSGPVTCVIWTDGTKTIVRCQDGETLDPEKGLAMAISKKFLGTNESGSNYYDEFRKWIPEYDAAKSVSFLDKRLHTPADDARELVNGAKRALDAVVSSVATAKEHPIETCRERLKREYPEQVSYNGIGGCYGCPHQVGYAPKPEWCCGGGPDTCAKCWDRPVQIPVEETKEKKPFNEPEVTHLTPPDKKDLQEFVKDGDRTPVTEKADGLKYEFTGETRQAYGRTLHRIRAVRDIYFPSGRLFVKKGELGGWIEKGTNLSHGGSCWVGEEACVTKHALVCGNAYVHGCASVRDHALVCDDATICEFARVIGDARVRGDAYVHGHALVCQTAIAEGNAEVCGGARLKGKVHVKGQACVTEGVHGEGVIDE